MKLLDSLLDAIVRLEGDALVMHVGEKPYVITASAAMNAYRGPLAWGQVELSSRVLTFDAVSSMLAQILPGDQLQALDEYGAIEHELASPSNIDQRFTVIAARGGEDVWVEVRRKPEEVQAPEQPVAEPAVEEPAAAQPVASESPTPEPQATGPEVPDLPLVQAADLPSDQASGLPISAADLDHIVVELPGDAAADVPLSAVPDEAFELVDDEPQGVPTEAEVDAMLAATASALLTSGLGTDHPIDPILSDDVPLDAALASEGGSVIDDGISDRYDIEVAPEELIRVDTTPMAPYSAPEAAFELSPPSYAIALLEEDDYEGARPEFAFEPPPGTPLFSEEAVLAAAAAPAEQTVDPQLGHVEVTYVRVPIDTSSQQAPPPVKVEPLVAEDAPEPEPASSVAPSEPAAPVAQDAAPVDVAEHIAVWSTAITHWSTAAPNVQPVEIVEPAALDTTPPGGDPLHEHVTIESSGSLPEQTDTAVDLTTTAAPAADHIEPAAQVEDLGVQPLAQADVASADESRDRVADSTHGEIQMEATPEAPYEAAEQATEQQPRQAVVVPLSRPGTKLSQDPGATPADLETLLRPLKAAAARGAATLYIVAQAKPMIRVDGEISGLDGEAALSVAEVERLVAELAPPRKRDALQTGSVEWLCDVPEVGRVRCLTFRDHRGPGVLFHMFPQRAITGDQNALPSEVRALCEQSDGLVLVTGARASGKSTLLNAFVDQINNTRSDHVVTVESQIGFVHESRRSFVSQRESRGDSELAAAFARTALHEDPDVMVIEDLKTADLVQAALDAAESGRLVFASVTAPSTIAALERLIELFPNDRREKVRASLAGSLRGVVGQVLLRRTKGGRTAAREILLNTPAISGLLREGNTSQLPSALENGRHHGMVPLSDSLATQVREGTVHATEAYRKSPDRTGLLEALKRDGIDTSFAERLA